MHCGETSIVSDVEHGTCRSGCCADGGQGIWESMFGDQDRTSEVVMEVRPRGRSEEKKHLTFCSRVDLRTEGKDELVRTGREDRGNRLRQGKRRSGKGEVSGEHVSERIVEQIHECATELTPREREA